jgi:hypothetical protein
MSDTFFVNSPFTISQNTDLYAETDISIFNEYDYILNINLSKFNDNNVITPLSINELFNDRIFKQNSNTQNTSNENLYDVTLTANLDAINTLLYSSNSVSISSSNLDITNKSTYNTLTTGQKLLGLRFLEIVATKIFGHAKARAAISNDTDFYRPLSDEGSLIKQIGEGINIALDTKKNTIFNKYVAYDRIELNPSNDVDDIADFNFEDTEWEFPIYFESTLTDLGNNVSMELLNNGPNVGGNILKNGHMNVPILLRFFVNTPDE